LSLENVQKDVTTGKNWIVTFPERAAAKAAFLSRLDRAAESRTLPRLRPRQKRGKNRSSQSIVAGERAKRCDDGRELDCDFPKMET